VLTLSRIPLAVAFVVVESRIALLIILGVAAATDLLDGFIARRIGGSLRRVHRPGRRQAVHAGGLRGRGGLRQPGVVRAGRALIRDIVASVAFVVTLISGRINIPARLGGKAVTFAQVMTVAAFLLGSRPSSAPSAGPPPIGVYAIWDYVQAARWAKREVGS
jgi:CDP-diacylglycerol--glycerol-3-phosphate 3-phosphatidyltransferase/cardiolipin synthase